METFRSLYASDYKDIDNNIIPPLEFVKFNNATIDKDKPDVNHASVSFTYIGSERSGGIKVWYDKILYLKKINNEWKIYDEDKHYAQFKYD